MDRETVKFFESLFDSLKREVAEGFEGVNSRLDRVEMQLRRQGGAISAAPEGWTPWKRSSKSSRSAAPENTG